MWNIMQCAVQGRSHVKDGIPCQDKTYSIFSNQVLAAALADGAGSAKLSHFGAEEITKQLCAHLTQQFDHYYQEENGVAVKQKLMDSIRDCLRQTAKRLQCEPKDLSSTLLLAAVKGDRFILIHIGDGVIGYLKNRQLKIASHPENGEFANTTVFTTSQQAINAMRLIKGRLEEIQGFVLLSDGAEASLYHKGTRQLAGALKRVMELSFVIPAQRIQQLLEESFQNVVRMATMDDCSILILTNDQGAFPGYAALPALERCRLLGIQPGSAAWEKRLRRFDAILALTQVPQSLNCIARQLYMKPKYARKYLNQLCAQNLIQRQGSGYQALVSWTKPCPARLEPSGG